MSSPGLLYTKFRAILFCCLLISAPAFADESPARTAPRDLVLLNWSEYLDPELVEKFERQFNARVREVYFESDDLRDDMLLETEAAGYDLVMTNDVAVDVYRRRGWLEPVTEKQVPNLRYIDPRWLDAFPGVRGYAVPYFWGTTGIVYRKDLVDKPMTSWMDLYRPAESLRGKIAMVENSRDLIGMALKALGYSANSADDKEIEEAGQLLMAQKPYVADYAALTLDGDSALVTGEIAAAILYSGDALMVQEFHPDIEYVLPVEGGNIWTDYLVVMKNANDKELAWAFINFLNEPEHAAQLAEYVYYATPNRAAEKLLPEEFLTDAVIYPDEVLLEKSEAYADLPSQAMRKRNSLFSRVTQ